MKGGRTVRLLLLIALLVGMYLFIFAMSAQDAETSGGLSGKIASLIVPETSESFENWHHLVRKSAHVTEFAVLFLLWFFTFREAFSRFQPAVSVGLPVLLTLLSAAADEFHQRFVPGRSGQVTDVLIDMIGVVLLSAIILLVQNGRRT